MSGAMVRSLLVAGPLAVAILALCLIAPTEGTMGHVQRIVYVHVPVAWLGLLGLPVMAGSGIMYLARRQLAWDHWFQAAGELGWLCCSLTLVTGSLWARRAWGTWWEWDPRLTTYFILWVIYSGILMVRSGLEDPHQRARINGGAFLPPLDQNQLEVMLQPFDVSQVVGVGSQVLRLDGLEASKQRLRTRPQFQGLLEISLPRAFDLPGCCGFQISDRSEEAVRPVARAMG